MVDYSECVRYQKGIQCRLANLQGSPVSHTADAPPPWRKSDRCASLTKYAPVAKFALNCCARRHVPILLSASAICLYNDLHITSSDKHQDYEGKRKIRLFHENCWTFDQVTVQFSWPIKLFSDLPLCLHTLLVLHISSTVVPYGQTLVTSHS